MSGMVKIDHKAYALTYNGAAMFALLERRGSDFASLLRQDTDAGIRCLRDAALTLSEQGELLRRYQGYKAAEMLADADVETLTAPLDIMRLRTAVLSQIAEDVAQHVPQKEIDLGLAELNHKNGSKMTRAHYLRMGTLCGLSAKETMLLPVGLVLDLWELYVMAHSVPEREVD